MSEQTTVFTEGFYLNKISDKAPEWVKANVSINVAQATAWLLAEANKYADEKGYIRLVGKESKGGKMYFEVDRWNSNGHRDADTTPTALPDYPADAINPNDIPF